MNFRVLRNLRGDRLKGEDRERIVDAARAAPPGSDRLLFASIVAEVNVWVARAVLSGQP